MIAHAIIIIIIKAKANTQLKSKPTPARPKKWISTAASLTMKKTIRPLKTAQKAHTEKG
jgi:hypothetical protein